MAQGKYWIITDYNINVEYDCNNRNTDFADSFWKSKNIVYSKGQLEKCPTTDKLHWQFTVCYKKKVRPATVKATLGDGVHCELSSSEKTLDYVHKDESSQGRRWIWGSLPFKRNSSTDWAKVKNAAKEGRLDDECIPDNVFVCHYASLKKIKMDYMKGEGIEKTVNVFWGPTGVGKSRRAWHEAGLDAYPKTPTTKFWDGYQGQGNVVIDEFTGQIEITHLLRWLDRYPVLVETKGSGTVLKASSVWITSNLPPEDWYSTVPVVQLEALLRRLTVIHMSEPWTPPALESTIREEEPIGQNTTSSQENEWEWEDTD